MADEQTGGAGSTGAGASGQQQTDQTPGQTSAQQTPANTQATQGQQQQTPGQNDGHTRPGATSGGSQTPAFDQKDFIPRHRFNEVSTKLRTLEEQNQDLHRRLTISLGGTPADPNAQKTEQVRGALIQMFPQLARLQQLSDEEFEALLQTPQHVSAARQTEVQHWERHGNQQLDTISSKVAEAISAETLDAEQRNDLRISLKSWLETRSRAELQQAADRYGDEAVRHDERLFSPTIQRYENGDPKLLDEFVTRYTKNWVEPARRSATARTSTRTRAVPDSSGRQAVTSVDRPASFKNWDERLDYAAKIAKERGVQFDR